MDVLVWACGQSGDWGSVDHRAWAYAVEAGYQLPRLPAAPWLRAGLSRASGDDDPADHHHRTFFQIIPTPRIYAQFPFYNLMNGEDLFAQMILKPHPKVSLRRDLHRLRLTEAADLWYAGGGATNAQVFGYSGTTSGGSRLLAHLAEVSVTVTVHRKVTAYAYYGRAFAGSVVAGTFPGGDASLGYVEMTFRK